MADKSEATRPVVSTTDLDTCMSKQPWSFVQMNMSLLPIARPLPVYTSPSALMRKKTALGLKPRTPNNPTTDKASTISPRRQGELVSGDVVPPLSLRERVLRKKEDLFVDVQPPPRTRCMSEEYWDASSVDSERGYDSDDFLVSRQNVNDKSCVRVKRILEILDEDRCKEDTMHTSPRSAKRRCQLNLGHPS
ncbi:hypothetical protein AC1031_008563 [Aphanomyces cochlioides]|nr:hypothetical protein AC1031_008563 [Aphanomyces cochlioides]